MLGVKSETSQTIIRWCWTAFANLTFFTEKRRERQFSIHRERFIWHHITIENTSQPWEKVLNNFLLLAAGGRVSQYFGKSFLDENLNTNEKKNNDWPKFMIPGKSWTKRKAFLRLCVEGFRIYSLDCLMAYTTSQRCTQVKEKENFWKKVKGQKSESWGLQKPCSEWKNENRI